MISYILVSVLPTAFLALAFMVGALLSLRIQAAAEAPIPQDDAQAWADALEADLAMQAVDAEWMMLAERAEAVYPLATVMSEWSAAMTPKVERRKRRVSNVIRLAPKRTVKRKVCVALAG